MDPDLFVAALGRTVTYKPAGSSGFAIAAIFRDQHAALSLNRGDLSAYEATATVRESDVPDPRRGDGVIVDGIRYAVRSIVPDGQGLVALGLERLDRARAFHAPETFAAAAADVIANLGREIAVNGVLVRAQVNLAGVVIEQVGGRSYETTAGVATVSDADASGVLGGMPVVIDGTDYRVRDIQPDGRGLTRLILEEV